MNIKETIAAINQMRADGIIDRYAIGGAVGAKFYLEPVATLDVDVFITFKPQAGQLLVTPQPIFEYLLARGGTMQGEYVVIAGWPVQFLPAGNPLLDEALAGRLSTTWKELPSACSRRNTSLPSHSRLDAPRTRPACFNSSKPARWMRSVSKPSLPGMASLTAGASSSDNSSRHELRPGKDSGQQARPAPRPRGPPYRGKAANARCPARTHPHAPAHACIHRRSPGNACAVPREACVSAFQSHRLTTGGDLAMTFFASSAIGPMHPPVEGA